MSAIETPLARPGRFRIDRARQRSRSHDWPIRISSRTTGATGAARAGSRGWGAGRDGTYAPDSRNLLRRLA
ncbi:hypothetical protein GCM10027018_08920 [Paenibacillus thermoaerophilus]